MHMHISDGQLMAVFSLAVFEENVGAVFSLAVFEENVEVLS